MATLFIPQDADYRVLFGQLQLDNEKTTMARCNCTACNSCRCACSCGRCGDPSCNRCKVTVRSQDLMINW